VSSWRLSQAWAVARRTTASLDQEAEQLAGLAEVVGAGGEHGEAEAVGQLVEAEVAQGGRGDAAQEAADEHADDDDEGGDGEVREETQKRAIIAVSGPLRVTRPSSLSAAMVAWNTMKAMARRPTTALGLLAPNSRPRPRRSTRRLKPRLSRRLWTTTRTTRPRM
jgi:hypothetical protein